MSPTALAEPPPLPSPGRVSATPLLAGTGTVLATIVARGMSGDAIPAFHCQMLRWTGIPCPGCGGTRCLAACGRLDPGAAFCWNPLVALVALTCVAWSALALASPLLAEQVSMRVAGLFSARRIAALVMLNWLYLCWALPR